MAEPLFWCKGATALFDAERARGEERQKREAEYKAQADLEAKMEADVKATAEERNALKVERARIEAAGGVVVHNRVNGTLAISRSFGDVQHKEPGGPTTVVATPEIFIEPVSQTEEFLVIATDGLWDVMSSQQVVNFVRTRLNEHRDLARVARELTDEALRNSSVDNVSAIVVAFNQQLQPG